MNLADVLRGVDLSSDIPDVDVSRVEIDSRRCTPGTLFFAMPGHSESGSRYIDDAVLRGAVAVVTATGGTALVPTVLVDDKILGDVLVRACQNVAGHPETSIGLLGVTGTNGKTSVTTIFAELWRMLGYSADVIGTLTHERTTPASPELYRELARFRDTGGERPVMALEVSSHALTQGRVDGLRFDVVAFTNLSLDHLDYHGSMEEYFLAKAELFTARRAARAVVFVDDPYGERLVSRIAVPVTAVSRRDASNVEMNVGDTRFTWRGQDVRSKLSGAFNIDNALIALTCAVELGASEAEAADAMASCTGVPGRFEIIQRHSPTVIVDYAHTPDGLERVLRDARSMAGVGRVVVVFGCGGDRDRTKRPVMGRVAGNEADVVVLTSDNPRSEDPEAILDEILSGVDDGVVVHREVDRRRAIQWAINWVVPEDLLVIAGKGHEKTQIVGANVLEFDDRRVARELLG